MLAVRLSSNRLTLRPAALDDLASIEAAIAHPHFPTKLPLSAIARGGELGSWLNRMCALNTTEHSAMWSVDMNDGQLSIGQVGLIARENHHFLSFWVSPVHWGQRIAREAIGLALGHWRTIPTANSIYAGTALWNTASAKVLLASGFTEGTQSDDGYSIDGESIAIRQFSLDNRQWHGDD